MLARRPTDPEAVMVQVQCQEVKVSNPTLAHTPAHCCPGGERAGGRGTPAPLLGATMEWRAGKPPESWRGLRRLHPLLL